MKLQELRALSIAELNKEYNELLRERFNLRMQKGLGRPFKPHLLRQVRRNIARLLMIMHEKNRQSS